MSTRYHRATGTGRDRRRSLTGATGRGLDPLLKSIEGFTFLLNDICTAMEKILLARSISRIVHLNSTERTLQEIKSRLDDAYRDFLAASALRVEVQQAEIAVEHKALAVQQTHIAVEQVNKTHASPADAILMGSTGTGKGALYSSCRLWGISGALGRLASAGTFPDVSHPRTDH
ncbi:hypothetical protein C8R46DRAFT_1220625 [Mycena filopes]|nr:hypothetical protein C8R46DRAFT_1220625 [Mycena filopes]